MADTQEKSKRPGNSAFKQQRLKAWQPLLTPKTVLPTFFVIGIIFIPLGIGLFITSENVQEIVMDYTKCNSSAPSNYVASGNFEWKSDHSGNESVCTLKFEVEQDIAGPVFLYYRLENFYQNHRRYVKSFSSKQLRGTAVPAEQLETDCDPLGPIINPDEPDAAPTVGYFPCGLVANSIFNDTYTQLRDASGEKPPLTLNESGIAWPGDKERYVKTQYGVGLPGDVVIDGVVPPPNWTKYGGVWRTTTIPDLSTDEHFQVWMRTAGLPTFRKLYGRFDDGIPAGTYELEIIDRYSVLDFNGTKSVVLSTSSWMGGKNPFLGIAYMVVGSICIALGVGFLIRHVVAPRKFGDHTYIKWKQSQ